MGRKRKRVITPAPRAPRRPLDLDRITADVHASSFWIEKTSVPLDGRRRR